MAFLNVSSVASRAGGSGELRLIGAWIVAASGALAFGPAVAQVDPLAALPRTVPAQVQAQPAPRFTTLQPVQTQSVPMRAAHTQPSGFEAYKLYLAAQARSEGVREATIQANVPGLQLSRRAMELDRSQPGGPPNSTYIPPFAPYRAQHVTSDLIRRGQARYSSLYGNMTRVQARYGVDPGVLMAIYGHETSYGAVLGGFDLLEALSTLAYEGRRRAMFETEFVAALKLIDLGVPRWRLKGSYAGATGYPQFMPSVVLKLRADGDGDGYGDIWRSEADGLASIANYLRNAGWKPGMSWGVTARVPSAFNRAAVRSALRSPRCERVYARHSRWLTVSQWRAMGVVPYEDRLAQNDVATLIEPDGPNGTAYLLTGNYRAILDYNCSNFYALSVGLLADAIMRR
jgi:membrane-bound lytic murein transglycosylase B